MFIPLKKKASDRHGPLGASRTSQTQQKETSRVGQAQERSSLGGSLRRTTV